MFGSALLAATLIAQSWTPELQLTVKSLADVIPSPDGKLVAWVQTSNIVEAERSETLSEIWLGRADGSARHFVSRGNSPVFSHDGKFIYYSAARSIRRIPVDGGESQSAIDWKGTLGGWRISPDGKLLAFGGREPDAESERARREKRDFRVIDENPPNHSLWLCGAGSTGFGQCKALTKGERHVSGLAWSPDSARVAFETRPTPYADDSRLADLAEVQVANGEMRDVAKTRATESQPRYSPDGRWLAFVRSEDPPLAPGDNHIVLSAVRTRMADRRLPDTYDHLPRLLGWSPDSREIHFTEARGTRDAVYAMPIDGPPRPVFNAAGATGGENLNAAGTHLGYVFETSNDAPEAFVRELASNREQRVSAANTSLPKLPMGKTDVFWWRSRDNVEVEGLLTYPAGYTAGKRVPLIVVAHGGPYGNHSETFLGRSGLYPLATFSARGYAIFRPNVRASTGYGRDFRFLNLKDWGGGDYQDLMTGVDRLIGDGIVDGERMAIMGWSYGGYMTAWTITHTKRFKAAAVGAGVTNLWSQTGTADIRANKIDAFGAPWENLKFYVDRSPMAHVANVTTPTLILHGEIDERVPTSQGYELYHALKVRGVPAKMVVYPRQPHGPREPKFVLDIMQRHLDWMEKYVR
jgi:dipeptidyl aminopeptidase/acylaminoacyl peptidase